MGWPDFVAALKVSQGWGSAQISGVVHDVDVTAYNGTTMNKAGLGIDAGVSFNLPSLGAGDQFLITGAYTQNATWYSGLGDTLWNGTVNDNAGQQFAAADTYYNGTGWQTPTAWSISAEFDHTFTPEFTGSIEGSYGGVNWSNGTAASVVSNATTWLVGGVGHYDPVKNLDFELELLYQEHQQFHAEQLCCGGHALARQRRRRWPPASRSPAPGNERLGSSSQSPERKLRAFLLFLPGQAFAGRPAAASTIPSAAIDEDARRLPAAEFCRFALFQWRLAALAEQRTPGVRAEAICAAPRDFPCIHALV